MARKPSPVRLTAESSGSCNRTCRRVPAGITAYLGSGGLGAGGASWTLACRTGRGSTGGAAGSGGAGAGASASALRAAGASLAGFGALGAGSATGAGSGWGAGAGAGATAGSLTAGGSGAGSVSPALSFLFLLHPVAARASARKIPVFSFIRSSIL
jgi:hypothetical protein